MKINRKPLALAVSSISAALIIGSSNINAQEHISEHIFSVDDLQVDFRGTLYGPGGAASDPDAICDFDGGPACPEGTQPFTDKEGIELYPVDTELGFNVVDFLGAQEKTIDSERDYGEGFIGNIKGSFADDDIIDGEITVDPSGGQIGVKISNAKTAKYKVKPGLGTWCQGLGGSSVKCSTEHYTVMEHVLSCNEVIPYYFYDFDAGDQLTNSFPDGSESFYCGDAQLDDYLQILADGTPGDRLTNVIPGVQMEANDNTTVRNDIAVSSDYSVTLKDDGKPLYRWGALIKRPNDIRLYAKLELPAAWKERDGGGALVNDVPVADAKLYVTHWITNNPNDQLRPEDLENEAATGRKPSYYVEDGDWKSLVECYEGDGDYLGSDTDDTDPTPIAAGTIFKNSSAALDPGAAPGDEPANPYAFSSDLIGGFTNGYYTTVNRNPFEWSYLSTTRPVDEFDFIGFDLPKTAEEMEAEGLELVTGPRWRLKPNKFGQDIPGLEIPVIECSPPPYGHDNIRYETGTLVTTVINLLDWDEVAEGAPSPLSTSKGWVEMNDFVEEGDSPEGYTVTTNGLPMTEDFDLAVYVKGDRKPTALYSARLVITEGDDVEPPPVSDLSIKRFNPPATVATGDSEKIYVQVVNSADATADGDYVVRLLGSDGTGLSKIVTGLPPGEFVRTTFNWVAPVTPETVTWTVKLKVDGMVVDTAGGTTEVVSP